MNTPPARDEFAAVVGRDMAQIGLVPTHWTVELNGVTRAWEVKITVADRSFVLGKIYRDGFYCEESTEGRASSFTEQLNGPVLGSDDRLLVEGLMMIHHALRHPESRRVRPPIV